MRENFLYTKNMAEEGERDMVLANFQAASGINDIDSAICILIQNDWDLMASLSSVMGSMDCQQASSGPLNNADPIPIDIDSPGLEADGTSIDDLTFYIEYLNQDVVISIPDNQTLNVLYQKIEQRVGLSKDEYTLTGWQHDGSKPPETKLSSLGLPKVTCLVIHKTSNDTQDDIQIISSDSAGPSTSSIRSTASVLSSIQSSSDLDSDNNAICLCVNHGSKSYNLTFAPLQTVDEVKQNIHSLTGIPENSQIWIGWPYGIDKTTKLKDAGLTKPVHRLTVSAKRPTTDETINVVNISPEPYEVESTSNKHQNNGRHRSIAIEDDYEDDDDDNMIIDVDLSTHPKRLQPMLPPNSDDSAEAMISFITELESRYGERHPTFYMGSLSDAIEEASGATVRERKPLIIYLHHDSSILSNIFCGQIFCSETMTTFIDQNFVTWAWDMSHTSNKERFITNIKSHFGNVAASQLTTFKDDDFPLLLVITKSRSALEVCAVLRGSNSLDELMTGLMQSNDVFLQANAIEIRDEDERNAREAVKREQDEAYEESLAADRIKAETERLRIQQETEARQLEEHNAQMKEAERLSLAEQIPPEPEKDCKEPVTNILFRLPNGARLARRFLADEKLQILFMFAASNGFAQNEYRVVTHFPRKELGEDLSEQTLQELSLCPQQTLFIEERD